MKRSTALVLTIIIFAAIAVCFLRPAYPDWYFKVDGGTVTIVARPLGGRIEARDISDLGEPTPIELEGDSDLIQIAIERFDVINGYGAIVYKASTAAEGREFISHVSIQINGKGHALPIGYMERLDGDKAGEKAELGEGPSFLLPRSDGIRGIVMRSDKPIEFWEYMPFDDPGLYRMTLCFYEWDSETRTILNGEPHEVSFTIDYKRPNTSFSVYGAEIDNEYTINSINNKRHQVTLLFVNNSGKMLHGGYVTLERKDGSGWINCDDMIRGSGGLSGIGKNENYQVEIKKNIEPGEYRLTISFSDEWMSDEARYAFTIHFSIE